MSDPNDRSSEAGREDAPPFALPTFSGRIVLGDSARQIGAERLAKWFQEKYGGRLQVGARDGSKLDYIDVNEIDCADMINAAFGE